VNVIKSSPQNRDRRDAIRTTWGAIKQIDDFRIDNVFLIGTDDQKMQHQLDKESMEHRDILQVALRDSKK